MWRQQCLELLAKRIWFMDFPGGPMVKTPHFHCRGHRFDPWSGSQDPTSHEAWQKKKNLVQRPPVSPPSVMAADPLLVPQTKLLTQYVLSLAKYDQNYDIRDRARFTRQLIVPSEQGGALSRHAKKLFLAPKPAPVLESSFKGGS